MGCVVNALEFHFSRYYLPSKQTHKFSICNIRNVFVIQSPVYGLFLEWSVLCKSYVFFCIWDINYLIFLVILIDMCLLLVRKWENRATYHLWIIPLSFEFCVCEMLFSTLYETLFVWNVTLLNRYNHMPRCILVCILPLKKLSLRFSQQEGEIPYIFCFQMPFLPYCLLFCTTQFSLKRHRFLPAL